MQTENHLLSEIGNKYIKESNKMDKVNVLNQMAEYDFNSPINVTMIFEDSDEEIDNSFENIRERESIQATNNNETCGNKCASKCLQLNKNKYKPLKKNNKIHKNKTKISKSIMEKIVNNNTSLENVRNNIGHVEDQNNVNKSVSGLHSCIVSNEVREDTESNENTVHTFVEDLLDKLSENLLMIMQSFYYYDKRKSSTVPAVDFIKLEKTFRFIKSHFFEVSYTTMETIILPLEQNSTLINQFLDNTMMIAELKFPKWKFHRNHMRVLLNELLVWSKQKQAHFKTIKQTPNRNYLREHLTRPPQPYPAAYIPNNTPNPTNVSAPSANTQNEMWCIFRSGAPGSQISINVNPDTLLSCTKKQNTSNTDEVTVNRKTFASSGQFPTRNTSVAPPPYNSLHKYYHQPSPHLNQNTIPPTQNRYNIAQQQQNRQNTGHLIQSYRTQVPYVNMNRTPPSESSFRNPLRYDFINLTNEMHEAESEPELRPVITNVTSYCPKAYTSVRCCMCGKMSEQTYYSNFNARPTYCSNLCQELDNQVRNSLCNST